MRPDAAGEVHGRIVITEFMDDRRWRSCARTTCSTTPSLVDDAPRLLAEAASADAIIVRNRTQVRGELLAALTRCTVVGRLGVGLDNIDVPGCEARGMQVIPATGANALSRGRVRGRHRAAAAARRLPVHAPRWRPAHWPRTALSNGREAGGKTLGLVGFGSIGQLTARAGAGPGHAA